MVYKYYYTNLNSQQKNIIQKREENDKLLSKDKPKFKTSNDSKSTYEEQKLKEGEEQKELITKKLIDYNNEANVLMELISKFLEKNDTELREQIKLSFKNLKERMKLEYKKFNTAKYYSSIVERAFYVPAIKESWVKISSIQYTRIPCQEMYDAVDDVVDYTNYYLNDLKECNVMELGK